MSIFFRITSALLVAVAVTCLSGCNDDNDPEPEPDTNSPEIAFAQGERKYFSKTITLSFTAEDEQQVSSVKLLIDGDEVSSKTFAATTGTLEFAWNTETETEGDHQLKVVAVDAAGNTSDKTFAVKVRNILMTIVVEPNALNTDVNEIFWVFASDSTGKTLDVKQLLNSSTVVLNAPADFTEETFTLTHYFSYSNPSIYTQRWLYSYLDVAPGTRTIPSRVTGGSVEEWNKESDFTMTNIPDGYGLQFYTNTGIWPNFDPITGGTFTTHAFHTPNTSVLINAIKGSDRKYYFLESVDHGDDISLAFNDLKTYELHTISEPNATSYSTYQVGLKTIDGKLRDFSIPSTDNVISPNGIGYLTMADNPFTSYYTMFRATIADVVYEQHYEGNTVATTFDKLNTTFAAFKNSATKISFTTTGSADHFMLNASTFTNGAGGTVEELRRIFGPIKSSLSFKIPVVPAAILAYYTGAEPATMFTQMSITESTVYDNYQDFSDISHLRYGNGRVVGGYTTKFKSFKLTN